MRSALLSLFMIISVSYVFAQRKLSNSARSSTFTYVYKITPAETKSIFVKSLLGLNKNTEDRLLHTLVDSFKTNSARPDLKPGNYLLMHTNEGNLHVEQYTAGDVYCKLLPNFHDLQLHVHNSKGQPISNAAVRVGNKTIKWDAATGLYRSNKIRKNGIVEVMIDGVMYCYQLDNKKPKKFKPVDLRKLLSGRSRPYYNKPLYFQSKTSYESKFKGFMVFSKPMYKPRDTVKLKAWIMPEKGKPVNRPLILRLTGEYFYIDTILATIQPYRPGAYEYSFVISDSLDLDLDEELLITLEEESSRKFDLDKYDGDLEDDEYALQRQVLIRNKFRHEQYELSSVTFTARTDRKEHNRNTPLALYAKAVNENDMVVMDGRIRIVVTADRYGAAFHQPKVFLPDTLWVHEQPMDAVGETKIILPDSIFPAASFGYDIDVVFLNSDNERAKKNLSVEYKYEQQMIECKQEKDSLQIHLIESGKDAEGVVTLYATNSKGDTLQQQQISVPATIRMDPYVHKYLVSNGTTISFKPDWGNLEMTCNSLRTRDSVFVQLLNPANLPAWYSVFEGNKLVQQGRANSELLGFRSSNTKPWFVSLQYVANDATQIREYTIPYDDKKLSVTIKQPEFVYPGQRTNIEVDVKDVSGAPVADADVTLFGYTRKFKHAVDPELPTFIRSYKNRKTQKGYSIGQERKYNVDAWLNWNKWSQRLGLDSIEYYKFLYTDSIYKTTEPAVDSVTQIAPFVVADGKVQAIHMLYIDDMPYFFKGAEQWQQYSFELSPGKHSLKLRTHNKLVYVDKIIVERGVKTILSINADSSITPNVWFNKMPDTMTKDEQRYWDRYLILVENNTKQRMAYVKNNQYIIINQGLKTYADYRSVKLIGPLLPPVALYNVKGRFSQSFEVEGGYQYRITEGLIKMKQWPLYGKPYNIRLNSAPQTASLLDQAITGKMVDSLWTDYLDYRNNKFDFFYNTDTYARDAGRLNIHVDTTVSGETLFVKNVLVFRKGDPDYMRIYKGEQRDLGYLYSGNYRVLLIFRHGKYFLKEDVIIKKDGINYYNCGPVVPHDADSMSMAITEMISKRDEMNSDAESGYNADSIKKSFNQQYFVLPANAAAISGYVSADGKPLAGVTVSIKNTKFGVVTDPKGYFTLKAPDKGIIGFYSVGYESQELSINGRNYFDIQLKEATLSLNEVIVTGYGIQKKSSLTGSVAAISSSELTSSLQGQVAGVMIRGTSTVNGNSRPLIIIDGFPVDTDLSQLNKDDFYSMTVLKDSEATSIWGARAANGVIVITTKKAATTKKGFDEKPDNTIPENTLRTNFRDEAYWFPALRTNNEGRAIASVTFPDDITNWKTFAIAASDKKEMGITSANVKSFKAVSGTLHLPLFAVAGDRMQVLGKAMNYGIDSVQLKRTFTNNGKEINSDIVWVKNSRVDSLTVTAEGDSVKLAYTIQRDNGYFDGEERKIPVFRQGVTETNGIFAALYKDTTVGWQPSEGSDVTVRAETSALPILMDEMDYVFHYEYACNEQLASKLKALLMKRKVYGLMKKEFEQDKRINEIIAQLNKSKSEDNLWGWWKGGQSYSWITLHVVEALLMAEEQQFKTELNKNVVKDYLVYKLPSTPKKIVAMLPVLRALHRLDSKILYKPWLDSLARHYKDTTLYESLSLFAFEQQLEPKKVPDSLIRIRHKTVFGNVYWGEEGYRFFDNSIQNTLLMYKILKAAGGHEELLVKIRHYFLEKKKDGHWRNTYESILILETILPDLLAEPSFNTPSSLVIRQGTQSQTVTQFPFTIKFNNRQPVQIEKTGAKPVYIAAFQQKWNPAPKKVDSTFSVSSRFIQKGDTVSALKGGQPVTMQVKVEVTADASYVMLEIPIPAGCSYESKPQSWYNNEVHREYFLNKVSIFCTELKKGSYTFNVPLLPRYSGQYNLNPANACMMYFPVFFGREGMKNVNIR